MDADKMPEIIFTPWTTCLCPKSFDPDDYKGWFCVATVGKLVSADGEGMSTDEAVHDAMVVLRKKVAALVEVTPPQRLDSRLSRTLELLDEFHPDLKDA